MARVARVARVADNRKSGLPKYYQLQQHNLAIKKPCKNLHMNCYSAVILNLVHAQVYL